MNDIPSWWFWTTGIAAILIAIFFLVLIFMVIALMKVVMNLEKPITGLVTHVNELVPTVKNLVTKVETLTEKVEGIADSAKGTVDVVGNRARGIATSIEHISSIAATKLGPLTPYLGTLLTGLKLYGAFRQAQAATSPRGRVSVKVGKENSTEIVPSDGTSHSKKGKVKEHRGVEQSGSSSGS